MTKFEREMLRELIRGDDAQSVAVSMDQYRFIGELAEQYDVSSRTIRFYEDKGFLSPKRRGRYRLYGPRDEQKLKFIILCRHMGLSISKIAATLKHLVACDETQAVERLVRVCSDQLGELQDRQVLLSKEMAVTRDALKSMNKLAKP